MLNDFISLVYPRNCIHCQQSLISAENYLCTMCKIDLPVTNDHLNSTNVLYQKFAFEPKVTSATSFLYFQRRGIAQKLLHELKYNGKKELGVQLGKWFAPALSAVEVDMIIPVPLHRSKARKRTYNQSEQIAKGLAETLNLNIKTDLVTREVATQTQTKKSRADRWVNMENVYSCFTEDLEGQSVLVVDDVITTGATVGMLCARLVESNVGTIHIASLARGK